MMALPAETEWIEFKEARNDYHFDELGQYFSALSNEANLMGQPAGWLLFGVTNKLPRKICGTNYRSTKPGLEKLKVQISSIQITR
jgi:ATP-dependent DNA helicase RecG